MSSQINSTEFIHKIIESDVNLKNVDFEDLNLYIDNAISILFDDRYAEYILITKNVLWKFITGDSMLKGLINEAIINLSEQSITEIIFQLFKFQLLLIKHYLELDVEYMCDEYIKSLDDPSDTLMTMLKVLTELNSSLNISSTIEKECLYRFKGKLTGYVKSNLENGMIISAANVSIIHLMYILKTDPYISSNLDSISKETREKIFMTEYDIIDTILFGE